MIIKKVKKAVFSSLVFAFSIGIVNPAFSAPPKDARQVAEHLEFLGFTSKIDSDVLQATNPNHFSIYASDNKIGIRFNVAFTINTNSIKNKVELMEILNELNAQASVIKFYLSENDIVFEAVYSGRYDKKEFGVFMQAYLSDYQLVYRTSELASYIGN